MTKQEIINMGGRALSHKLQLNNTPTKNCSDCVACADCVGCNKCSFCYGCSSCINCKWCVECSNLRGREYCIGNVQFNREEFIEILNKIRK